MKKLKNKRFGIILCLAALSLVMTAAGCKDTAAKTESSVPAATSDAPEPQVIQQETGEHKDYDKENAKCYESNTILVAEQDGLPRGMEEFVWDPDSGYLEFYANELNTLKEKVSKKVKIYSMVVPSACELYCPANERSMIDSQEKLIKEVKDMLIEVASVDVLPILQAHNAENIYFRTDSRWTSLGAYYAGKTFAQAAGVPYAELSEYTQTSPKDYIGDFQNMCGPDAYEEFEKNPDKFSYYEPNASFVTNYYDDQFEFLTEDLFYEEVPDNLYDSFYKGGYYCLRLDTKVENGRKLLIIKDDFGTAFPSNLTSSFSQIYVVSYDYLEANLIEMIDEFEITDVLYLLSAYTVTDQRVYKLETLRTQATHGSLEDAAPTVDPDEIAAARRRRTGSETDGENDTDTVQYIYGIGINNQIGIIENSDEEELPDESDEDYAEQEEDYGEEYGEDEEYVYDEEEEDYLDYYADE